METLVDTNLLIYRYDHRFPEKQRTAVQLLREGMAMGCLALPHQAVIEFVAAVRRPRPELGGRPILAPHEAYREAEELLRAFPILYPTDEVVRLALQGVAAFQLSWFDAHIWAYAEAFGIGELLSEDFEDGRYYGNVRVRDPFAGSMAVHDPHAPGKRGSSYML